MSDIYYAGVGSRETPPDILEMMANFAYHMAGKQIILRSGHADGADKAFEMGCDLNYGRKEIYLPWPGFNDSTSEFVGPTNEAFTMASEHVPHWKNMRNHAARKLHARNMHQVLGYGLNSPVLFVMCWTQEGKLKGGTATAIRVAHARGIPVFNLGLGFDPSVNAQIADLIKKART